MGLNIMIKELLEQEQVWLDKERNEEWYIEGIELYKQLKRADVFNQAKYNLEHANLLLEYARNEKMSEGNMRNAEKLLKNIINLNPEEAEIYYRLAFINAHFKKWEAVLFYANEAIEYGISEAEEIKLSALMGCAYRQIGLVRKGKELIEHAYKLDKEKEWILFIEHYDELSDKFVKFHVSTQRSKEDQFSIVLEETRKNLCCILSLYSRFNFLIVEYKEIQLSLKEAELLELLIKFNGGIVSNHQILNHIWPEVVISNPNSTVVKRTISPLRMKLSEGFIGYRGNDLIYFENGGYRLNLPKEIKIFKGIDYRRLSCY